MIVIVLPLLKERHIIESIKSRYCTMCDLCVFMYDVRCLPSSRVTMLQFTCVCNDHPAHATFQQKCNILRRMLVA